MSKAPRDAHNYIENRGEITDKNRTPNLIYLDIFLNLLKLVPIPVREVELHVLP